MAGKKIKKRQVQVRNIATRSSPPSPVNDSEMIRHGGSIEEPLPDGAVGKGGSGHPCRHLERGVNVEKLLCQLAKSRTTLTNCQDCAKERKAAAGKKGKGRSMRKKLAQNHSFHNETDQALNWVCLVCGHVGCGAISASASAHSTEDSAKQNANGAEKHEEEGFPKGHSWKHAFLAKHPLALQCGDKLVCWCFMCNVAIDYALPLESSSEMPSEVEDSQLVALASSGSAPLRQAAKLVGKKLVKERVISRDQGRFDHIDQPPTSLTDALPDPSPTDHPNLRPFLNGHCSTSQRKRLLKGLMNLGNTCFFNSVMQNLLALDLLRDYFSQDFQVVEGPLTSSLRRLYLETNPEVPASKTSGHTDVGFESGLKRGGKGRMVWESSGGAYNPRSLFGAICTKAPRFRGFQQQDSHELLRCLLEGLSSEERSTCVSEGESSIVARLAKNTTLMQSSRVGDVESLEETEDGDAERPIANTRIPNFVEFFFGGQLSSTVRCCECGHTSVVYEPILDLSLQISTRQVSKKGQARAIQGSSEKGPSHRFVKSTKAIQSLDWPDTPNPCSLVVSENRKISSEIMPSASKMQSHSLAAENAITPKISPKEEVSLDDCGWLDFVAGGIQSAEGSLQGSLDVISSAQNTENIWIADTEGTVQENVLMNVLQPFSSDKCGTSHLTNHFEPVNTEVINESVGTPHVVGAAVYQNDKHCPVELVPDSSATEAHQKVVMASPVCDQDVEIKMLVAQPWEEDGPLPMASGVLLLPYEQLQVPNVLIAEGVDCIQAGKFNLDESSCSLEGEDKSTQLNSVVEEDNVDFDGFSQLFEEDETFTVKGQSMEVTRGVDDFQVTEESYHSSWDADTGPVIGGESGLIKAEPQKVFSHQDSILPMSLEGCLADFTKAELLSGENAWECESCSKCVKEKVSPLASNKDSDKPICNEGVIPETGGENLGNNSQFLHRYDPNSVGKDVGGSSVYSNGNVSHVDYVGCSMVRCMPIGTNASAITGEDGLCSEILLACRSQASSNGKTEDSASTTEAGDLVGGKVEVNPRIGNGSARLNELDSGQLCGSLGQRHNAERERGNCSESLGETLPKEMVSAEQIKTGDGETSQYISKDRESTHGDPSLHTGRHLTQSSGKKHVEIEGDLPSTTSSNTSEEKLAGPYRISGKSMKSQKYKKRKPQLENVKAVKRDATKRLLISKAPPILTIHLKRFAQDIRGRLNKLCGHVAFPLLLDLRPFLDSKCLDLENCVYRLVGIVEHGGTMRGGHYVAYVRGPPSDELNQEGDLMEYGSKSSWYYISDSSVHKSTLEAVLNSEAYLLFYEKCQVI